MSGLLQYSMRSGRGWNTKNGNVTPGTDLKRARVSFRAGIAKQSFSCHAAEKHVPRTGERTIRYPPEPETNVFRENFRLVDFPDRLRLNAPVHPSENSDQHFIAPSWIDLSPASRTRDQHSDTDFVFSYFYKRLTMMKIFWHSTSDAGRCATCLWRKD